MATVFLTVASVELAPVEATSPPVTLETVKLDPVASDPVTLEIVTADARPDLVTVVLSGLPSTTHQGSAEAILRVVAVDTAANGLPGDASLADHPGLLGSFQLAPAPGDTSMAVEFHPRFPVAPGMTVVATVDARALEQLTGAVDPPPRAVYTVPWPDRPPATRVESVSPSGAVLPSNLLRVYVHFSAPMGRHPALPHVRLLDADGQRVPEAFVDVPKGLWDPDRTRLTLFVHPGRVKRGVGPNQVLGLVLREGQTYHLRIDAALRDARGEPLAEPFDMRFTAGPADYESPAPQRWRLHPPVAPDAPLTVDLDAPADRGLLARLPWVENASAQPVPGRVTVDARGSSWHFVPDAPWSPGDYSLVVPQVLEDPSGNRIDRLFEGAPGEGALGKADPGPSGDPEPIRLRFTATVEADAVDL